MAGSTHPSAASYAPANLALGDFNSDGRPDLAVCIYENNAGTDVATFMSGGNGNFTSGPVLQPGGNYPLDVGVGDLTGDSIPDVLVAMSPAGTLKLYAGRGDGGFGGPLTYTNGPDPRFPVIVDLNSDGVPDLITASNNAGQTRTLTARLSSAPGCPIFLPDGG